jgi:hypothetical protein
MRLKQRRLIRPFALAATAAVIATAPQPLGKTHAPARRRDSVVRGGREGWS